jgi:hypothetical protein
MSNTATNELNNVPQQPGAQPRKPNESGTISVQAHMRIFDPQTQKVFVEGRA